MLRLISVLTLLTGTLFFSPSALASDPMSAPVLSDRTGPTVKADLRVIGTSDLVPAGLQSGGGCTDTSLIAGDKVRVRDARTGKKLAVGTVGRCHYEMAIESHCIPGLGCTPAMLRQAYKLLLPRLPYTGVSKYAVTVGDYEFKLTVRQLANEKWQHYFSA